jgi:hypothetical protein
MMLSLTLALAWAAAGYRVWISLTRPRTVWRTSFTAGMLCTASALTLWAFRESLDRVLGAWNLTNLLSHAVFVVGIGFVLIYDDALRRPVVSRARVAAHLLLAAVVIGVMTSSWLVAPIHDRFYADMSPLADTAAVASYYVAFYVYVGVGLVTTAYVCFRRGREFRRADLSRSVSLMMSGSASVAALAVLALWTFSMALHPRLGHDAIPLAQLGTRLLPIPILLLSTGVLVLLVMPWVISVFTTARRWGALQPLWRSLIQRYPEVHLEMPLTGGLLNRLQIRETRAIIEIHDALRLVRLDIEETATTADVARALRGPSEGHRSPAEVLRVAETREADVEQMLELARAWNAAA